MYTNITLKVAASLAFRPFTDQKTTRLQIFGFAPNLKTLDVRLLFTRRIVLEVYCSNDRQKSRDDVKVLSLSKY